MDYDNKTYQSIQKNKLQEIEYDNYSNTAMPIAVIYKTKKDYSEFVPVILSPDKKRIVSYPAPVDLYFNGKLAYPTVLKNGYLLDNRGINENVAFTNISYEAYSKLKQTPSIIELYKKLIDKNPLVEIIFCGPRNSYPHLIQDLNKVIDNGFKGMRRIRI